MKIFYILLTVLLLTMVLLPYDTSRASAVTIKGTVQSIVAGSNKDLGIVLQGDNNSYYINRALEKKNVIDDFNKLKGKKVSIMYARHWSQRFGYRGRHVTELRTDSALIYSAFSQ